MGCRLFEKAKNRGDLKTLLRIVPVLFASRETSNGTMGDFSWLSTNFWRGENQQNVREFHGFRESACGILLTTVAAVLILGAPAARWAK